MMKKIVPFVVLAAFLAAPVATPAFAAGDKKADKAVAQCQKIKNEAKKAKCLEKAKAKMKK